MRWYVGPRGWARPRNFVPRVVDRGLRARPCGDLSRRASSAPLVRLRAFRVQAELAVEAVGRHLR
eukprot:10385234-Lingulodinium_polyedra.AAC.1